MKFSKQYINSHDIDWFAIYNGRYIHVASAGAPIPDAVNDKGKLRQIQEFVRNLPEQYEFEIHYDTIRALYDFSEEQLKDYISSFASMARKGFFSYDKVDIDMPNDEKYYLVASPKGDVNFNEQLRELLNLELSNFTIISSFPK